MKVKNKGFGLLELIVASVLFVLAVGGGLVAFQVANREVEKANAENMAIGENESIQEMLANLDFNDPRLTPGRHEVSVSNPDLQKYQPRAEYEVINYGDHKGIKVTVILNYGGKEVKVETQGLKTNYSQPVSVALGGGSGGSGLGSGVPGGRSGIGEGFSPAPGLPGGPRGEDGRPPRGWEPPSGGGPIGGRPPSGGEPPRSLISPPEEEWPPKEESPSVSPLNQGIVFGDINSDLSPDTGGEILATAADFIGRQLASGTEIQDIPIYEGTDEAGLADYLQNVVGLSSDQVEAILSSGDVTIEFSFDPTLVDTTGTYGADASSRTVYDSEGNVDTDVTIHNSSSGGGGGRGTAEFTMY